MKNKLLIFVLLFFSAGQLMAQWTNDTRLNTCIIDTTGQQIYSQLALDAATGTGFISWFSNFSNNQYDVYLNMLNKDGMLEWEKEGLMISNHPTMTWITFYQLIQDDDHCAVLVNQDVRNGWSNPYAYRISSTGEFLWGDNGIQLYDNENLSLCLSVVQDHAGDYLFAWTDDSTYYVTAGERNKTCVMVQKVRKDMSFVWDTEALAKNDTVNFTKQFFPIILKPDNGFYLVFSGVYNPEDSTRTHPPCQNLYVQSYNQDGEALWGDPVPLERDTLLDVNYGISANAYIQKDGGIIVLWNSALGVNELVKMQHLDATGNKLCGEFGTYVTTNVDHRQTAFWSTYDSVQDNIFVFWDDKHFKYNLKAWYYGIAGQKINSNGVRQWSDTGILITPYVVDTSHIVWDVSMHPDGSVVTIFTNKYTAYPPGGNAYIANILSAFRIDSQGSLVWNPGVITVSDTVTYKFLISISEYTNGEWIATWSDGRTDPPLEEKQAGIYAQNIRQDGTLGPLFIPGPGKRQKKDIAVYPNPFTSKATITFVPSAAGEVILTLYNSSGIRVRSVPLGRYSEGTHSVILNREGLAPGIYLLNIANGRWQATEKVMVY